VKQVISFRSVGTARLYSRMTVLYLFIYLNFASSHNKVSETLNATTE